jgi:hypothetical protein
MINSLEIRPNEGFGEIKFGEILDNVFMLLGEPQELDSMEDDEELNMLILHYWDLGFSIIFEGTTKQVVAGFETDHPDATLFGKKIIGMPEKEVIALMKDHGYNDYETDIEDGDERLTYEDILMDFYLRDGKVIYVNWGALVNEDGEVEEI